MNNKENLNKDYYWIILNSWNISIWNSKVQFYTTKNNLNDYFQITKWSKKYKIYMPYNTINQKYKKSQEPVQKEVFLSFIHIDPKQKHINFIVQNYDWISQYIINLNNWKVIWKFVNRWICQEIHNDKPIIDLICFGAIANDTYQNKKFNFINTWYENYSMIELSWKIYIKSISFANLDNEVLISNYDKKSLKLLEFYRK